jgi:hypothetical protein
MSISKPLAVSFRAARTKLAFLAGLAVLTLVVPAQASTTYPAAVSEALEMPCPPPCTICHQDTNGGLRTVVQPFGVAMMDAGLGFFAPETVPDALAVLLEEGTDSDGDGETDVDELGAGQDPNGDLDFCGRAAMYGCFNSIAPVRSSLPASGAASVVLGLMSLLWVRRVKRVRGG